MKRRQFIKKSGLFLPAAFGIFVPCAIRASSRRGLLTAKAPVAGCSGTALDMLLRMDVGTNGSTPTTANLDSSTFGLATGTWSKVGSDSIWVANTSDDISISGLSVSGTGCGDPTTKCFSRSLASNGSSSSYPLFTFGSSKSVICVGFALKLSGAVDEFDIYNLVRLDTSGGNFFSCTIEIDGNTAPDTLKISAHAGSADGTAITGLALATWWWIAMKLDGTSSARLRVYSLPGLVQQTAGTSESVATRGGTDACTAVRCGMTDPTGATAAASTLFWDDIAMRFADVHPLLPT